MISSLRLLVEQVSAAMKLIESAVAREAMTSHPDVATNVVILDDVTARYVRANAALSTYNAGLGIALHLVHDSSAETSSAIISGFHSFRLPWRLPMRQPLFFSSSGP